MRNVSTALATLINSPGALFDYCHLYTFTLFGSLGGTSVIRLTDAQEDVLWAGNTWSAKTVLVDQRQNKRQAHWKRGLDVDQTLIILAPRPTDPLTGNTFPDLIGSVPFLQACIGGALDGADIQIDRAFFPGWPGPNNPSLGSAVSPMAPTGIITIFAGTPAEIDVNDTLVAVTCNDYRQLLQNKYPRRQYQLGCVNTLYDSECGLNPASFQVTGTVSIAPNRATITATLGLVPPTSPGSGTFLLGKLTMTSGLNAGFSRTVRIWSPPSTLGVLNSFPFTISPGDTFSVTEGCDKLLSTCTAFANAANFGGQPFIPDATTAV